MEAHFERSDNEHPTYFLNSAFFISAKVPFPAHLGTETFSTWPHLTQVPSQTETTATCTAQSMRLQRLGSLLAQYSKHFQAVISGKLPIESRKKRPNPSRLPYYYEIYLLLLTIPSSNFDFFFLKKGSSFPKFNERAMWIPKWKEGKQNKTCLGSTVILKLS